MERIQWKRGVKGLRKPPGAKFVTRQKDKKDWPVGSPQYWGNPYPVEVYGREQAIALYRRDVEALPEVEREEWLAPLRQASALICWCRLDEPCHADVLIEYLDRPPPAVEGFRQ